MASRPTYCMSMKRFIFDCEYLSAFSTDTFQCSQPRINSCGSVESLETNQLCWYGIVTYKRSANKWFLQKFLWSEKEGGSENKYESYYRSKLNTFTSRSACYFLLKKRGPMAKTVIDIVHYCALGKRGRIAKTFIDIAHSGTRHPVPLHLVLTSTCVFYLRVHFIHLHFIYVF